MVDEDGEAQNNSRASPTSRRRPYRRPLLSSRALLLPPSPVIHHRPNHAQFTHHHPVVPKQKNLLGSIAIASVKLAAVLVARIFCGKAWPFLQTASLSTFFLRKRSGTVSKAAKIFVDPLRWLSDYMLWTSISQYILRWCWSDAYRTFQFWRRLLPIYIGYISTKWQVRNKPLEERHKAWRWRHEWGGEKVYHLILDMSGFYVKSAQILASKAEFVPEAWTKHLAKLLDNAPPRPFNEVKRTIQKELKKSSWYISSANYKGLVPLDAVFLELEKVPLAAASIAQVHGATLQNGMKVAVKVQHKGMELLMRSDLRNIAWLAKFLQGQLPVDIFPIVKEIQSTIPLEFDFEREVWFMKSIKHNLESKGFKKIVCPSASTDFCTKRLIVMERIDGVPFSKILNTRVEDELSQTVLAVSYLLEAYGQMIFIDGVFHADPHAGNLFLLPDGRLALLDYGQSKKIEKSLRQKLSRMILALYEGDELSIALALLNVGVVFQPEAAANIPLKSIATAAHILFDVCFVEEATVSPMSQNSILKEIPLKQFNQALWMVIRTILLLRGLCFSLNVNISAKKIWRPYAIAAIQEG